jgi:hypothetical protein
MAPDGARRAVARPALRLVIPSGACILLAFQTAYGAFFLSELEIRSGGANQ